MSIFHKSYIIHYIINNRNHVEAGKFAELVVYTRDHGLRQYNRNHVEAGKFAELVVPVFLLTVVVLWCLWGVDDWCYFFQITIFSDYPDELIQMLLSNRCVLRFSINWGAAFATVVQSFQIWISMHQGNS